MAALALHADNQAGLMHSFSDTQTHTLYVGAPAVQTEALSQSQHPSSLVLDGVVQDIVLQDIPLSL